MAILRLLTAILSKIKHSVEMRKYNNYTIAEYFRKQGAQIGENCCIFPRFLGTEPYLVKIGNHVCINAGVHFHTHDGGTWVFREKEKDLRVFGPIIIEDNCFIGEGSKLLPNITIKKNSIVAAGSIVITDVPENSIVMGIPARSFGSLEKYKEKCIKQWKIQKPANFHPDSQMNWELSKNAEIIREQLRKHLEEVFKDKLY